MKKLIYVLIVIVVTGIVLTGCGKSKQTQYEETFEELGLSESESKELAKEFAELEEEENEYRKEQEAAEKQEESEEEKQQKFLDTIRQPEKASGWDDISLERMAIQIDSILWQIGITAETAIERIENASEGYEYDVNLDKLIEGGKKTSVTVCREGIEWFYLSFYNFSDEVVMLRECALIYVIPTETAIQYSCRMLNGDYTYDNIMSLDYNSIDQLNDILALGGFKVPEKSLNNVYTLSVGSEELLWTGFDVTYSIRYSISIDADTSKVNSFSFVMPTSCIWSEYRGKAPTNNEEWAALAGEQKAALVQKIKQKVIVDYGVSENAISDDMYFRCGQYMWSECLFIAHTVNGEWHSYYAYTDHIYTDISGMIMFLSGPYTYDGIDSGKSDKDELLNGKAAGEWIMLR